MKRIRIFYPIGVLVLLFAGLLTGRREVFLLLLAMLLVLASALILNLWTFFSFCYLQELSVLKAVKGETITYKLRITNEKPFPFTQMKIHVQTISPSEKWTFDFDLSPKSSVTYEVPLKCVYRGVYSVGMTVLEVNDIFGLLHMRFNLRILPYYRMVEVKVFPRLIRLPYLPAYERDSKYRTSRTNTVSDQGDSFSVLRGYRPGDAMKKIHWPSAARRHELLVRNYDAPTETSVSILIDNAYNRFEGEDILRYADLACECATAIANCAILSGYAVAMSDVSTDSRTVRESEIKNFAVLHDYLAVMPFPVNGEPLKRLRVVLNAEKQMKTVYYITANVDPDFENRLMEHIPAGCQVKLLSLSKEKADSAEAVTPGLLRLPVTFGDNISSVLGERLWD